MISCIESFSALKSPPQSERRILQVLACHVHSKSYVKVLLGASVEGEGVGLTAKVRKGQMSVPKCTIQNIFS